MACKITYDLRNISIQPVARLLLLHPLKQTKIWHSNVGDLLNSSLNAFCAPHHHQHQDRRKKGWEMVLGSEVSFLIASWMQMINVWRQQPSPPLSVGVIFIPSITLYGSSRILIGEFEWSIVSIWDKSEIADRIVSEMLGTLWWCWVELW